MNSISSSRNWGQGIYKMIQETFTAGTFPSVAAGKAAPRPTCASCPCTPLLCGPDLPPTPCLQLLPCQSWLGLLRLSREGGGEPSTPARPWGSVLALCQRIASLSFSKGGPGPPACNHLHPCQDAELQVPSQGSGI